ncbi:MAG: hypothetical protein HZA16_08720 [Nitrospirae bacterium]|nr:hypothetical protein [Nitrospirota bacterium]
MYAHLLRNRNGINRVLLFTAFMIMLSCPIQSPAFTLNGESKTYFQSRETSRSTTVSPGFEYLDFVADEIGKEEVSFHAGGWARYKENDEEGFAKNFNGDLQYAYLSFKRRTDNTVLNLGRLFISEGAALEQIDGIYKHADIKGGFGIAAFGGVPVETDFDERDGDVAYGGRITHETSGVYRAGVSYLKEQNSSDDLREEGGFDISLFPVEKINVLGRSSYNIINKGIMEHAYFLALGPIAKFRITPEFYWADYGRYLTSATTQAFTFLNNIDPEEKVIIFGGEASYAVIDNLLLAAQYKHFDYDIAEDADYYGGRLSYSVTGSGGAGLSAYRMDGKTDDIKYTEYRAYINKKIGQADMTVDVFNVSYDQRINDVKNAYAVSAAVGYELTDGVRFAADLEYGKNPFFDEELKVFLKFLYRFGTWKIGA